MFHRCGTLEESDSPGLQYAPWKAHGLVVYIRGQLLPRCPVFQTSQPFRPWTKRGQECGDMTEDPVYSSTNSKLLIFFNTDYWLRRL